MKILLLKTDQLFIKADPDLYLFYSKRLSLPGKIRKIIFQNGSILKA